MTPASSIASFPLVLWNVARYIRIAERDVLGVNIPDEGSPAE